MMVHSECCDIHRIRVVTRITFVPHRFFLWGNFFGILSASIPKVTTRILVHVSCSKHKEDTMKTLQKLSKFLSDYTAVVVIAIAVVTFLVPGLMGWVNISLFTDFATNKFTSQSVIIGIIMFSMGLTLTTDDFKILAQRPVDICIGAIAQYLIMPAIAL